jgi:uncharacterized protein (DUF924 family)
VDSRVTRLLDFWFADTREDPARIALRVGVWFGSDPTFDDALRDAFAGEVAAAARGDLDLWRATPAGTLALVILLDQLPRNLHRGSALAFAQDERARVVCLAALARANDVALRPIEAAFLFLPLEHAEDPALQERCVACYAALLERAPAAARSDFEGFLAYARSHRDVIARFGRFPHRNAALGRISTPEEQAWLTSGGGF